jgi:integrase/recombinase XerD
MGSLRKQMDADMVVRGMAERTRETYLSAVAAMAKFYRRSPDESTKWRCSATCCT